MTLEKELAGKKSVVSLPGGGRVRPGKCGIKNP